MKKTLKVLLAVVITPIALFLILTLLLYCPPVQKWAVDRAAQVASEKTGMRITVEQLRLSFPLDLRLQGLKALQPNDSLPGKTDTIADVRSLTTLVWSLIYTFRLWSHELLTVDKLTDVSEHTVIILLAAVLDVLHQIIGIEVIY